MSKLLQGAREMQAWAHGMEVPVTVHRVEVPATVDVRRIRAALGLSQHDFAHRYGFSVGSVRNWEQGHRHPTGAARVLLTIIAREPEAVSRALAAQG